MLPALRGSTKSDLINPYNTRDKCVACAVRRMLSLEDGQCSPSKNQTVPDVFTIPVMMAKLVTRLQVSSLIMANRGLVMKLATLYADAMFNSWHYSNTAAKLSTRSLDLSYITTSDRYLVTSSTAFANGASRSSTCKT